MPGLSVNGPYVVAEVFDNEVVVIHLERGTYYSLTGAACQFWPLLGSGRDAAGIAAALAELGPEWAAAQAELVAFAEELMAEELVQLAELPQAPVAPAPAAYQPPKLEKFTDMEELIALDPVHDVSAAEGWPLRTPLGPETR